MGEKNNKRMFSQEGNLLIEELFFPRMVGADGECSEGEVSGFQR
jgi:hypothetical protein